MAENENVVLPPKYYLDYFNYLLGFVQDKYRHILAEKEWRFLRKYYALSEDAQCLFIRFSNRKGIFFRTEKLAYEEIGNIYSVLDELTRKGFIEPLSQNHIHFQDELFRLLTKPELLSIYDRRELRSKSKSELIDLIKTQYAFNEILVKTSSLIPIVKVNFEFETTFFKFLFFGNRYMDMTEFVVRDLGFVQYFHHDEDKLVARFDTRKDAEDKWMITDQTDLFDQLKNTETPETIYDWFETFSASVSDLSEIAKPAFEKLRLKVGRHLEKFKAFELAVEIYKSCGLPQAKERHVRCLVTLKKNHEALALCESMVLNSTNADEIFFAKDFMGRILKNTASRKKKLTTEKLHLAQQITIPSVYRGQVELGAIEYFLQKGKYAVFSENYLWRGIFGLAFWKIIFDPTLVRFHHPFQRRPSDLHLPDFYEKRSVILHQHLDSFLEVDDFLVFMRNIYVENEGIANPFVIWAEGFWETIRIATLRIGLEKLKPLLIYISKDIAENSRGFPDLFVWDENGEYEFVEIKSPTDNLSNRQLYWLGYFEESGIKARVLRVFYKDENKEDL
jgi:hypothetical protein